MHFLDRKIFKDLAVKLLSFLCTQSTECAALHFLQCVNVFTKLEYVWATQVSRIGTVSYLSHTYISHVLAAGATAGCDAIPISDCCIPCLFNGKGLFLCHIIWLSNHNWCIKHYIPLQMYANTINQPWIYFEMSSQSKFQHWLQPR